MGSSSFEEVVYTEKSYTDTYADLREAAAHEYGHGGYSGAINTTHGVSLVQSAPLTIEQARQIVERRIDGLSKWSSCEVISIVKETPAVYESTGTQTVEVTMTGAVYKDTAKRNAAIAKAAGIKVADIARVYEQGSTRTVKSTPTPTEGKSVTKYFILNAGQNFMPKWEEGHASQAEARAVVNGEKTGHYGEADWEVIAITRRESGAPLLTAQRRIKSITATYRVDTHRLVTKATTGTTHAGWLFYGMVAH